MTMWSEDKTNSSERGNSERDGRDVDGDDDDDCNDDDNDDDDDDAMAKGAETWHFEGERAPEVRNSSSSVPDAVAAGGKWSSRGSQGWRDDISSSSSKRTRALRTRLSGIAQKSDEIGLLWHGQ